MEKISNSKYSLEIPDNWKSELDESGYFSVFNPLGNGAITISSFTSQSDIPCAEEALKSFAKIAKNIKIKKLNDMSRATVEYEELADEQRIFIYTATLCKGNELILFSYNCKREFVDNKEIDLVKKIFETVEIK